MQVSQDKNDLVKKSALILITARKKKAWPNKKEKFNNDFSSDEKCSQFSGQSSLKVEFLGMIFSYPQMRKVCLVAAVK